VAHPDPGPLEPLSVKVGRPSAAALRSAPRQCARAAVMAYTARFDRVPLRCGRVAGRGYARSGSGRGQSRWSIAGTGMVVTPQPRLRKRIAPDAAGDDPVILAKALARQRLRAGLRLQRRTTKVSLEKHKRCERAAAIGLFRCQLICPCADMPQRRGGDAGPPGGLYLAVCIHSRRSRH
jgi:hypothetical protein